MESVSHRHCRGRGRGVAVVEVIAFVVVGLVVASVQWSKCPSAKLCSKLECTCEQLTSPVPTSSRAAASVQVSM